MIPEQSKKSGSVSIQELTIPLIGGGMAILKAPVPMSMSNFDLIITMIQTMKQGIVVGFDSGPRARQKTQEIVADDTIA